MSALALGRSGWIGFRVKLWLRFNWLALTIATLLGGAGGVLVAVGGSLSARFGLAAMGLSASIVTVSVLLASWQSKIARARAALPAFLAASLAARASEQCFRFVLDAVTVDGFQSRDDTREILAREDFSEVFLNELPNIRVERSSFGELSSTISGAAEQVSDYLLKMAGFIDALETRRIYYAIKEIQYGLAEMSMMIPDDGRKRIPTAIVGCVVRQYRLWAELSETLVRYTWKPQHTQ